MANGTFSKLMVGLVMLGLIGNTGYAEVINPTAIAPQIQDSPQDVVNMHLTALRKGDVDTAMRYVHTSKPLLMREFLNKKLPEYKSITSVKYLATEFDEEHTIALVKAFIYTKEFTSPAMPYMLEKTPTGWMIFGELSSNQIRELANKTRRNIPPITTPTQLGTPEDIVKNVLNATLSGQETSRFYESKNPNLGVILARQQAIFRNQLESIQLGQTHYKDDKNFADVDISLTPLSELNKTSEEGVIKLHKQADGTWKILVD